MIIVDKLLEQRRDDPIRVGIAGAGFMARGLAIQIADSTPGMTVVAVLNRTVSKAEEMILDAEPERVVKHVDTAADVDAAVAEGAVAVTSSMEAFTEAASFDAVIDATGHTEWGARLAIGCIATGKHNILLNAEMDATIGPYLVTLADEAGVIYTGCDGDQPGVQLNLARFVQGIGMTPLVCGNIKGLQDEYRTPTTQAGFAAQWGQDPYAVTSFADGTKISAEQAIVANALGMTVHRRGMLGRDHAGHVDDLVEMYDVEELKAMGGAVDYVVGSKPPPGVYVLATQDDPRQKHYLRLYKLGDGPLYCFYTPYHLCHFEVPTSVARAVLLHDATLRPLGPPKVDAVTMCKTDLVAGTELERLGGYTYYGIADKAEVSHAARLLPVGLAEGCVVRRDLPKDHAITIDDVQLPPDSVAFRLRREQDLRFFGSSAIPSDY